MLNELLPMAIEEIIENDRQADTADMIKGLAYAGYLLSNVASDGNEADKNMAIDGMSSIISAMAYVSLMNQTVNTIKQG